MFAFLGGKYPVDNSVLLSFFRRPMNCVFVHGSSTHEFEAIRSDCLVQFSILNPFSEPHECYCLALFMCPPPLSLEPREVIADPEGNPPFSPFFRSPINVIALRCSCVVHLRVWSYVS